MRTRQLVATAVMTGALVLGTAIGASAGTSGTVYSAGRDGGSDELTSPHACSFQGPLRPERRTVVTTDVRIVGTTGSDRPWAPVPMGGRAAAPPRASGARRA